MLKLVFEILSIIVTNLKIWIFFLEFMLVYH